ncbi:MAG: 3-methyladenine DNA glycosylase AlkD [Paraglaciecola sp.]|jgi:3-methyladenine DNA glycosylase AlkD
MTSEDAILLLEQQADEKHRIGLARYAIPTSKAIGVRMPAIRQIAKGIGRNQSLAEELWAIDLHEAKHLAAIIADPNTIQRETIESWVRELYAWDVCDNLCDLIAKTPYGLACAKAWCQEEGEFVKRSGFVTFVWYTVHQKEATNQEIIAFLPYISQHAWDDRNFVKKAINWLLRQIGRRNLELNVHAIRLAEQLLEHPDKSARWIAKDALRELTSNAVQERLAKKEKRRSK